MEISIKKNNKNKNSQIQIFELGIITTTLQSLLDSSKIFIESDKLIILSITDLALINKKYLLQLENYNGDTVYGLGKNILESDLILLSDSSIKVSINSPTFTGTPSAPTATVGTNTTQLATTAFVLANGSTTPVSSSQSGIVNNIPLQELGGVDKLVNGLRIGRGNGNLSNNTVFGESSLQSITSGDDNTAIGNSVLSSNTTGFGNTALGRGALSSNITGLRNTAIGRLALSQNTTGSRNIAIGVQALEINTGSDNIVIGAFSGFAITSGINNTYIGAGSSLGNTSNTIILASGTTNRIVVDSTGKTNLLNTLRIVNTPLYIDNTAAIAGGLIIGDVYRTSLGVLMIVF